MAESARKICRVLQENAVLLNPAKPVPARIAVVNDFKNQIFNWCASDKVDLYVNSVMGLFHAAYDAGYNVDVVEPGMMTMEAMKQYQVVLLPFPYYIEEKTALLLKQWVAEGGMLISEALFGSVNGDLVRHVPSVPGFGFDEVFGATEERFIRPPPLKMPTIPPGVLLPASK
ncbi:MAG: beta-galactosidase trimerization domain-containing protein [Hydrogeniiclostridium mannosilyticum]